MGTLTAGTITPLSQVVGQVTSYNFAITLNHPIPANGKLGITFPIWNPAAPSAE